MAQPNRVAACLTIFVGLGLFDTPLFASDEATAAKVKKLVGRWGQQADAIVTYTLEAGVYRYGPSKPVAGRTRAEMREFFDRLDLDRPEASLEGLRKAFPPAAPNVTEMWGAVVTVRKQGAKLRTDSQWPRAGGKLADPEVHIDTQVGHYGFSPYNRQLSLMDAGGFNGEMVRLTTVAYLPTRRLIEAVGQMTVSSQPTGRLLFQGQTGVELLVDPSSGVIERHTVSGGIPGRIREFIQRGAIPTSADVTFPKVSAEIRYDDGGRIEHLYIYHIRRLEVNREIDDSVFDAIDVPAGTNVVDFRGKPAKPAGAELPADVSSMSDVVAWVTSRTGNGPEIVLPVKSSSRWWVYGVLAGLVLAGVGMALRRRSRLKA